MKRLLAAALLLAGSPARAAEPEPPPVQPLQEVEVRGAPPPRSASETVLDEATLKAAPHKNASELLLSVPGVVVSQHSGKGKAHQIFFRGFNAIHGQDVEIWAGGAPVNDVSNIHGQGYADLHFLIPEVIREVRSTPGTYDPRQGDFAVAGSLQFSLGYDEPGVTLEAGAGSFGTKRLFLGYHPPGAPEETFGAFELDTTDGFGPSRAASRAAGIAQVVHAFGSGVQGRLLAATYAGRFDSAGVLRLDDLESGRVERFDTYDSKQGGSSSRSQVVLELSRSDPDAAEAWSIAPYLVLRGLELRSNFTGTLTSPEGDSIQQLYASTTLGATASYRRTLPLLSAHDAIEAGIRLRSDVITESQHRLSVLTDEVTDDAHSPGVDAEVRATDAAGYVDVELHPVRRVTLRGGLRADGLAYFTEETSGAAAGTGRSAFGSVLSKRGTLDVFVLPGTNAFLSFGDGFRSPQALSLGDGESTPFTRVVSYELGVRFRDARRFQASLAAYRTELGDDLVFEPTTARNERAPGTTRTGLAADLRACPSPWLLSSTSLNYVHAVFDAAGGIYAEGDRLPYVPELVVRTDLAFTPVLGRLFGRELRSHFGAGMTYFGRRPLPYSELGHDAFLVDASAELRLGPAAVSLEAYNLLDAEWYDGEFVYASNFNGASLVPARHVTVGPPRTLILSLALFV